MNTTPTAVILLIVLALMPNGARADVVNGSFEDPNISPSTFIVFSSIPGWTTTAGPGIEIIRAAQFPAYDGLQFVELDSNANSGMTQTVSTTAGESYLLSFAYSPRRLISAESNTVEVLFNGTLLDTLSLSGIGLTGTAWQLYAYTVLAVGPTSSIEFRAGGTSSGTGGFIDNVQFTPVPEPASLLLLSTGIAGTIARRRTLRRAGEISCTPR